MNTDTDITSLRMHLNELRSRFDQVMRKGEDFHQLKELHVKIKELECHIRALDWNRLKNNPPRSGNERNRHSEDPRSLL